MKKILLFQFLNIFAPNKCYFCGKIGDLVCAECQSNQEFRIQTVRRKSETRPTREFFLGDREGVLAKILDEAKFNGLAENFEVLAKILAESLKTCDEFSSLKDEIVIVPAPRPLLDMLASVAWRTASLWRRFWRESLGLKWRKSSAENHILFKKALRRKFEKAKLQRDISCSKNRERARFMWFLMIFARLARQLTRSPKICEKPTRTRFGHFI